MGDFLNGIGLGTLSTTYLNTASQDAQSEASTIFASLSAAPDTTTPSDSAAFSLASIAALADGGAAAIAAQEAAASSSGDGYDQTAQAAVPSTAQPEQSLLDRFAGIATQALGNLPAPAIMSAITDPGAPSSSSPSSVGTI